jgi:hypothetical protein
MSKIYYKFFVIIFISYCILRFINYEISYLIKIITKKFMLYFSIMRNDVYYHHKKIKRNITLVHGEIKKTNYIRGQNKLIDIV